MRSFRTRQLAVIVGLVALTSAVLGVGAYFYVATSLRDQQLADARAQTNFNVAVLADERLPPAPTRDDVLESDLLTAFELRGGVGTAVDFGDDDPLYSGFAVAAVHGAISSGLREIVSRGEIGYERLTVAEHAYLVTGARRPGGGPDFYFVFDAAPTETAIANLGQALAVGGVVLVLIALVSGGLLARGVLRPVREASEVAGRIANGELSARLDASSDDEFGAWAASFNRMAASLATTVDDLRAAEARQRRFVSDVSHELRTPLTALVQEAALVRDGLDRLPPDARRAAELLVGDVARLRTLVDELMELSRFDAAAETLETEAVDVSQVVRALAPRLATARLVMPEEPVIVATDRRRVERILANLLDNAAEHARGAEVEVSLRAEPERIVLLVADRGPGVAPEQLEHLFDRFRKADPSRHRGGSGLGLAIAREHAELLGGTLRAELRGGGGLAFELDLPVTQLLPARDGGVTNEPQPSDQPLPQGS